MNQIKNAADIPLDQNIGNLPDVSSALLNWFQPMTFVQITKKMVNFQLVESAKRTFFQGVMQPFTPQQLTMKPEGQRAWNWYQLHAETSLVLVPDEVVQYLGQQYRVKTKRDYTQYGYIEYELILDYVGSGP